jgi:hypothetical protein
MKNLLFKSNPNELSTFAILIQMGIFGAVGVGSIIFLFQLLANAI